MSDEAIFNAAWAAVLLIAFLIFKFTPRPWPTKAERIKKLEKEVARLWEALEVFEQRMRDDKRDGA
jgi:hypothetical protein